MRDDEAVILLAVGVDRLGELEPDFVGHVLRADLGDLLRGHVGDVGKFRNGGNEMVDAHLAGLIGSARGGGAGTGDRAAGGENGDVRKGEGGAGGGDEAEADQGLLHGHGCLLL